MKLYPLYISKSNAKEQAPHLYLQSCFKALPLDRWKLVVYCCLGLPWWIRGKESACSAGDTGSIPGSGRSPRDGNGNLLQYSCLENTCGQRSLAGYSPWGLKESDMTEWLNNTNSNYRRRLPRPEDQTWTKVDAIKYNKFLHTDTSNYLLNHSTFPNCDNCYSFSFSANILSVKSRQWTMGSYIRHHQ